MQVDGPGPLKRPGDQILPERPIKKQRIIEVKRRGESLVSEGPVKKRRVEIDDITELFGDLKLCSDQYNCQKWKKEKSVKENKNEKIKFSIVEDTLMEENRHILLVEGEEIFINKEKISRTSPFFKKLLLPFGQQNLSMNSSMTVLQNASYQATKDCIDAITYPQFIVEVIGEGDIDRATAFLDHLLFFELTPLFRVGESVVVKILDKMKGNDLSKEKICGINKEFYDYFCAGKFPQLREKLAELGRPSLIQFIQDVQLKALPTAFAELNEMKFPCYGLAKLLQNHGSICSVFADSSFSMLFSLYSLDPLCPFLNSMLGMFCKPSIDQHDKYKITSRFFERALLYGGSEYTDFAAAHLSELLQTGVKNCLPDFERAKKILQETIELYPLHSQLSRLVLAQLLTEEDSIGSLKMAYRQLAPMIICGHYDSFSGENDELFLHYFQFLVVTKGFLCEEKSEAFEKEVEKACELPLEIIVSNLLFSIYASGPCLEMTKEEFIEGLQNEEQRKVLLKELQRTPFYLLAQTAVKAFQSHKARIFKTLELTC